MAEGAHAFKKGPRTLKRLLVSLLSLTFVWISLAPAAFAATTYPVTYNGSANFVCDAASLHPVTSIYQFSCRGINFYDANNAFAGTYYFRVVNWFLLYTVNPVNGDVAGPAVQASGFPIAVTGFTLPSGNIPGTFAFNWTWTDANKVVHTGSVSGTWENFQICGGRGCQYWAPKLVTNAITINN
jgi:hypothetical protein